MSKTSAELEPKRAEIDALTGPALVEFVVRADESVYPMVVPGTSLAEVIVNEAHASERDPKTEAPTVSPEPVGLRG